MYKYRENSGTYWSGGELRRLAQLHLDGYSWMRIAEILQRSPSACQDRLRQIRTGILFQEATPDSKHLNSNIKSIDLNDYMWRPHHDTGKSKGNPASRK